MVRPASFGFNNDTAASNAFQINDTSLSHDEVQANAVMEFDNFVKLLREKSINVLVAEDTKEPIKNDAVFPNNWITTHADGTLILYPMSSSSRKFERSTILIENLHQTFKVEKIIHLKKYEENGRFLEGTGSMVLYRVNQVCYACISTRKDLALLKEWCDIMHYELVSFKAVDGNGQDIYHTNVLMAIGGTVVVICLSTIQDEKEKLNLITHFELTKKEVIEISIDQMLKFAGNMLQVKNENDDTFLVMSKQAFDSLYSNQITQIKKHTQILYADIKTIETYGGGSARCMIAEIFFKKPPKLIKD